MPLYFCVLQPSFFSNELTPALAACWRQRSFQPWREFCRTVLPAASSFAQRYHIDLQETVLHHAAHGLPFDRDAWRCLVGETLLFGAVEAPEIETAPDTLRCLLAPESYQDGDVPRERFAPIQQVHFGTRDLVFGGAFYRPERAGWNDVADVARLSAYLDAVDSARCTVNDLLPMAELESDEDRADELAYAREWFPALQDLYRRALRNRHIIVCEVL
jgi:hypothetical protein